MNFKYTSPAGMCFTKIDIVLNLNLLLNGIHNLKNCEKSEENSMWHKINEKINFIKQKGAVHILVGSFSTKFVALFGSVFIVRLLTKEDYGLLGYIENIYSFVYIIGGLGLSNATIRYVVLGDKIEEKKSYYTYIRNRSFVYNSIFVILFTLINLLYPHPQEFTSARNLIIIMLIMLPFQYSMQNDLVLERAMFNNVRYAYLSFITSVLFVLAKIAGAFIGGIIEVLVLSTLINIACCMYTQYTVNRRYFRNAQTKKISSNKRKEIDIYSLQFMITNGLWTLFVIMDVFLLSKLGSTSIEIADYKVAYIWPANIGIIGSCIAIFITPYFVRNESNIVWIRRNFKKLYILNILITLIIGVFVWLFAKPLIYLYSGAKYLNTIPLMRTLLIGAVINNGFRIITANVLAAMGQVKHNMFISLIGFALQIVLDFYFIPKYGSYGVAYTSIIVYSFMAIALLIIFICKYYRKNIS